MKTPTHPGIWEYWLNSIPPHLRKWVRVEVKQPEEQMGLFGVGLVFWHERLGEWFPAFCFTDAEWREVKK